MGLLEPGLHLRQVEDPGHPVLDHDGVPREDRQGRDPPRRPQGQPGDRVGAQGEGAPDRHDPEDDKPEQPPHHR